MCWLHCAHGQQLSGRSAKRVLWRGSVKVPCSFSHQNQFFLIKVTSHSRLLDLGAESFSPCYNNSFCNPEMPWQWIVYFVRFQEKRITEACCFPLDLHISLSAGFSFVGWWDFSGKKWKNWSYDLSVALSVSFRKMKRIFVSQKELFFPFALGKMNS